MSSILKQWLYYALGILLLILGAMFAGMLVWSFPLQGLTIGGFLFGIGCYLCSLGEGLRQKRTRIHPSKERIFTKSRNVSTSGGTYNEQIQGDSIIIQGNQIYLGQDLSEFTIQIKEILNQLQNQGCDAETAEEQVIDELKTEINRSSKIKTKLLQWKEQLGVSASDLPNDIELAEIIVNFALEQLEDFSEDSVLVVEGKYQNLHDLLEAGQWQEADQETLKVICSLMPDRDYCYIDVDQIPPKDLKRINQLWVRFSNGRFGFSVQKNIWIKILKAYHADENSNRYWIDDSAYYAFTDCVGWSRESNRIYHTDIEYSLKAPQGHLPAILMFKKPNSNYCYFNQSIFDKFMNREYSKIPLIPSWLERWFKQNITNL
jgi:hypothetical protein